MRELHSWCRRPSNVSMTFLKNLANEGNKDFKAPLRCRKAQIVCRPVSTFYRKIATFIPISGIQTLRRKLFQGGSAMRRIWVRVVLGIVAASSIVVAGAAGQIAPSQSVVTDSSGVIPE